MTVREVGGKEDLNISAAELGFSVVKKRDKAKRERERERERALVSSYIMQRRLCMLTIITIGKLSPCILTNQKDLSLATEGMCSPFLAESGKPCVGDVHKEVTLPEQQSPATCAKAGQLLLVGESGVGWV